MRTLLISDLHSNEPALTAVLARARRKGISRIFCLGDVVGYGAQPNQVVDRLRTLRARKVFIRGNHDRVVAGSADPSGFNHAARAAAEWTASNLSRPNQKFLQQMTVGPVSLPEERALLCHGSPFDEDEYLFSEMDAYRIFREFDADLVFFGHTHLPSFFELGPRGSIEGVLVRKPTSFRLRPGSRYLINPGSVGQPRDRNPLAAYAIWDSGRRTLHFQRAEYDIERAQTAILRAGLPRVLADRLRAGS